MTSDPQEKNQLGWLMKEFEETTPGVSMAVLLSVDGLPWYWNESHNQDQLDHLSAAAAGLASLAYGTNERFDCGGPYEALHIEYPKKVLLLLAAGEGAVIATFTEKEADISAIGTKLSHLVQQLAPHLSVAPRSGERPTP